MPASTRKGRKSPKKVPASPSADELRRRSEEAAAAAATAELQEKNARTAAAEADGDPPGHDQAGQPVEPETPRPGAEQPPADVPGAGKDPVGEVPTFFTDRILDERFNEDSGESEYQVLWKPLPGQTKGEISWEPEDCLPNNSDLQAWKRDRAKKPSAPAGVKGQGSAQPANAPGQDSANPAQQPNSTKPLSSAEFLRRHGFAPTGAVPGQTFESAARMLDAFAKQNAPAAAVSAPSSVTLDQYKIDKVEATRRNERPDLDEGELVRAFARVLSREKFDFEGEEIFPTELIVDDKLSEYQRLKVEATMASSKMLPRATDVSIWSRRFSARLARTESCRLRQCMSLYQANFEQVCRAYGFRHALRYEAVIIRNLAFARTLDIAAMDAAAMITTDREMKADKNMKTAAAAVKAAGKQ